MRTIAYVDGYNLYFGCLKYTTYKWLDVVSLIESILAIQDPAATLVQVKYFTAPIRAKLASHGELAAQSQQKYHRALASRGRIEIIEGRYSLEQSHALEYVQPPDKSRRVAIWRLEEKETDVNIALHLYRDALRGEAEQHVLVSSDSDMLPVLKFLKQDFPDVRLGVILPIRENTDERKSRPPSGSLSSLSDWTRHHILNRELAENQLPARVPTRKKPVDKPDYW